MIDGRRAMLILNGHEGMFMNTEAQRTSDVIHQALAHQAPRTWRQVDVIVTGSTVRLRGRVDSWFERQLASGAAWAAPGITQVVNELVVRGPT